MTETTEKNNTRIYEDARNMVRDAHDAESGGKKIVSTSKLIVATSTIGALSDDPSNVAALLPMILEMYLRPDPSEVVEKAVEAHAKNCGVKKILGRMSIAMLGAGGGGGLIGVLLQRLLGGQP